ncbi:MAG: MOSC domain-containing protein [Nitrospiraceae bacterium]
MPQVAALYRYPVKGFTPEACDVLSILSNGRVAGDRVLGIRFSNTEAPDDAWSRKTGMVALVNTPGLARLNVRFDSNTRQLIIRQDGETLADEVLDADGRKRIGIAVANYVLALVENPLASHPERLPLRVVGDGITPRYHDSEAGQVTLHGRESLRALAVALGNAKVSELRFRSNIAVDGLGAWEEQRWVGRRVRKGAVELDVVRSKLRCLATHANPKTGERDLPILTTLTKVIGQKEPTFAVAMVPTKGAGEIRLGDEVIVID